MHHIIHVSGLRKTFKTHKREAGLGNALRSLLHREYVVKEALRGISFEVEQGELVGFIGPNGAGKSTTIKALSGVLYPTAGTVRVLGYTPWKDRISYVKNIGVVFGQKSQLWWDLPAQDSFFLNSYIYDIPKERFSKRLAYLIAYFDLQEVSRKPVRDLSLGERMKCQLVAALLHQPPLVFLDEPSIGLDTISKNLFRDLILKENRENKTTFLITSHDIQEIERLSRRVIIINDGEIIFDGALEHIKKRYLHKKLIEVKLLTRMNHLSFPGAILREGRDYEMKIELDTKKSNVKSLVDHLLKKYQIEDINITDPPIEDIVAKIYQDKKA